MNGLLEDVRYAVRAALRSPGLTLSTLSTLALAIAANTAIFSVVNAVLFRPLAFPEPERLVRITGDYRGAAIPDIGASSPEMRDYLEKSGVLEEAAGVYPINANLTGGDRPERVETLLVSPCYFLLLGARAQLGRVFGAQDEVPGIGDSAVISHGLWQRLFGGDPGIVGRHIQIDRDLYTIAGVMPATFRHPGRILESDVEVWAPSGFRDKPFPQAARRAYFLAGILARLKPGVSLAQAQDRIASLGRGFRKDFPSDYREAEDWAPRVIALHDDLVGRARPALLMLLAAVALVLLIAVVNIAGLLLSRTAERAREFALRSALGAGRARLVRQLLVESLLLGVAGGLVGLAASTWSVDALLALAPASLPRLSAVRLDASVLVFTLGLSALAGLLAGIAPALSASGAGFLGSLKEGARSVSAGRGHARARALLVASELALALMLLVGAGLLARSFARVLEVDPGFDAKSALVARVWLPTPNDPETGPYQKHERRVAFLREAVRRLAALPGVRAVGSGNQTPLDGSRSAVAFAIAGRAEADGGTVTARSTLAGPGYFRALGIPVVAGRDFDERDDTNGALVAIVNQAFARRAWPGQDALGKQLKAGGASGVRTLEVVGVVRDTHADALDAAPRPELYRSQLQGSSLSFAFVLRADRPEALVEAVRREVQAVDPDLPVYAARTLEGALQGALAQRRFAVTLVGIFALASLLLSAIGIYGVMAESVQQRRREIGVRMALGARPGSVLRLVVGQGLRLALAGAALGLVGALAGARLLAGLLFGIGPLDLVTFAAIPLLLLTVAAVACWLPARRAAALDPIEALRSE